MFSNYVPNVKYHLINVSRLKLEEIEHIDNTLAGIFLLEKEIGTDKFAEIFQKVLQLIKKKQMMNWKAVVE